MTQESRQALLQDEEALLLGTFLYAEVFFVKGKGFMCLSLQAPIYK